MFQPMIQSHSRSTIPPVDDPVDRRLDSTPASSLPTRQPTTTSTPLFESSMSFDGILTYATLLPISTFISNNPSFVSSHHKPSSLLVSIEARTASINAGAGSAGGLVYCGVWGFAGQCVKQRPTRTHVPSSLTSSGWFPESGLFVS